MPSIAPSHRFLAAIAFAACLSVPLHAATPRDELLHYVPEQVGFCLVLNDLRGHGEALANSPFVEHFLQTQLGKDLTRATEVAQLLKLEKDLKSLLGIDWQQLRDDIIGDAVVLAYRPGPPGKPEQEQGLILVHARDTKLLARMIDQINAKQKQAGDLKALEEKEHKGLKYVQRTEKKDTNFYYLDGSILLFTGQEELLRQALDLGRAAKKDTEPPIARHLRELGAEKTLLSLWINPRAFDAALAADLANPKKSEAEIAFNKGFTPYWKALDSVVVSIGLEKDLKVRVGFQARMEALPAAARRFFQQIAKPSDLWRAIPDDALLAVAGRVDAAALFQALGGFMPEASRKSAREDLNRTVAALLGKEDFFKDVLTNIGPDVGMAILAPPADQKAWFPDCVAAIGVGGGEKPTFGQSMLTAINTYAFLAILGHNKINPDQQMSLKTVVQGEREVRYLANDSGFPPGFQPALALHKGYVVLASSPEVLQRFADKSLLGDKQQNGDEVPLLRASLKDLRKWLSDRREALTPVVAEQNKLTQEEARQRMTHLLGGLEFIDRLEISQRTAPGQVVFTLTLQTAQPLQK